MTETQTFNIPSLKEPKEILAIVTVQKRFFEKCPDPSKFTFIELIRDYNLPTYLHNEKGYAAINPRKNIKEVWLDGLCITKENPELAARIIHNANFDDKFTALINEPDAADGKTE